MAASAPKNPPSERRVAANRANARKSTGPRTAEGKARSRQNAVKHGLTGAGVALPTEDAAQVEERFAALQEEMAPQTLLGTMLVRVASLSFVRVERAARQETASVGYKVRHAAEEYREARLAAADEDMAAIAQAPRTIRRRLMMYPEGVDRLIEQLRLIRGEVRNRNIRWSFVHEECLEQCWGRRTIDLPRSRGQELSKALEHDPAWLTDDDRAAIEGQGGRVADWARPHMEAYIDAEIARLEAHRATLDPEVFGRDRAEAPDRALFDPGRDAALARRYEAAALRNLYRALREFRAVESGAGDPDPSATGPAPEPASAAAARAIEAGDAARIPDPADEPARPKPQQDNKNRPPLASFGLSAEEVSRQLNRPHFARPATPAHEPLPDLWTGQPIAR